jgi:hypothetical protein
LEGNVQINIDLVARTQLLPRNKERGRGACSICIGAAATYLTAAPSRSRQTGLRPTLLPVAAQLTLHEAVNEETRKASCQQQLQRWGTASHRHACSTLLVIACGQLSHMQQLLAGVASLVSCRFSWPSRQTTPAGIAWPIKYPRGVALIASSHKARTATPAAPSALRPADAARSRADGGRHDGGDQAAAQAGGGGDQPGGQGPERRRGALQGAPSSDARLGTVMEGMAVWPPCMLPSQCGPRLHA